jgi:long-chain acyl-CoA synthetase
VTANWLIERMSEWANEPAIVWHDEPYSYGQLIDRVDTWRSELDTHEITAGNVVALEGDFSPNACALILALLERRAISVPLTPAVSAQRDDFLAIAEAQALVEFDEDDGASVALLDRQVENPLTRTLIDSERPGLIVFSSGSTGTPKAILHDFDALLEKFATRRRRRTVLTFLLLDHMGGINTLLHALANGGTIVSVPSREPDVVCKAIQDHEIDTLPTSPTFLNLLLISEAYRRFDLSSLKLISYGTEPMPEATLTRLHEMMPNVDLLQTYGLSELGVLRSKSRDSGSLWVKVGGEGFETRVVDGLLHIRARSAMVGYLNAPSPFDDDGWLNTEDMVEVDGEYIRILGRTTDLINVGGQKVYPAEVESVLLQMPNVRDAVVYGEANPLTGQVVAASLSVAEPEEVASLRQRVRAFCRERLASYKMPVRVEISADAMHGARFKRVRKH